MLLHAYIRCYTHGNDDHLLLLPPALYFNENARTCTHLYGKHFICSQVFMIGSVVCAYDAGTHVLSLNANQVYAAYMQHMHTQ